MRWGRYSALTMPDLLVVAIASLFAGMIDAIVGGGGLILMPALFAIYPGAVPAALLGTNKAGAIWGTAWAAMAFTRRVRLAMRTMAPAVLSAFAGSFIGAWAVTGVDASALRRALPLVLLAILAYTLVRKDLGRHHAPRWNASREPWVAALIGAGLGFYDGFFGPGTGSFFVFLFVRALGYDFLHASAAAKLLNTATNLAAIVLFSWKGHVWWQVAAVLGLANVAGSLVGTRLALKHGAGFVRAAFIIVVSALILKTGYDAFVR